MDFRHYINSDQLVLPRSVQEKMATLGLRLKDLLWTFNFPMKETRYPAERKYRRMRWFGSYWTGLYCKWDEYRQKWVILTCWRDEVLSIS
jgi:hypothetical protein